MNFCKLLRVPVTRFVAFSSPRLCKNLHSFKIWQTAATPAGPCPRQNGYVEVAKQKELEDVYDLGRTSIDLRTMTHDDTIMTLFDYHKGTAAYKEYQRLASKLNIDLPDLPLEKTVDRKQKQNFVDKQIKVVETYILSRKPKDIGYLYTAAMKVESFRRVLDVSINTSDHLTKCVKEVEEAVQNLDVDIKEELNRLENYYSFNKINGCLNRIKRKLCKETARAKLSEVDPIRMITNRYWVISLVRLPDTLYSEHAFLILEGKTGSKSMIWFVDFVASDKLDLLRPGIRDGKVRMEYHESEAGSSRKLLFQCSKMMMKIRKDDRFVYSSWLVSKSAALKLIQNVETQKNDPPKYIVLGDSALATGLATASSKSTGHNCFTFAKKMLHDLNDEYIQVPADKVAEWIVSAASRFLVDNQSNQQTSNQSNDQRSDMLPFGIFTFLAGAVTAFVFPKVLNL